MSKNSYSPTDKVDEALWWMKNTQPGSMPKWHDYDQALKLAGHLIAVGYSDQDLNLTSAYNLFAGACGAVAARGSLSPGLRAQFDQLLDSPLENLCTIADQIAAQRELARIQAEQQQAAVA